jgi:phosphoglycolate phosphatase
VANLLVSGREIASIQLVIFDKDGTIMELYHYWSQMIGLRARLLCRKLGLDQGHEAQLLYVMGVDRQAGRLRPEGPVGLKKREIVLQAAVDYLDSIGQPNTHDLCAKIFEEVDRVSSDDLTPFIKPIPGAIELIDSLKRSGCKLAIATTDRSSRAALAMAHLGLTDKFDIILGAEAVQETKPHPEMVWAILAEVDMPKEQCVMVGDALTDIQMGINAGLKASIAVLTGFATYDQCREITPYIAETIGHIQVASNPA